MSSRLILHSSQPGSLAMRGKKSGRAIKFTGQAFGVGAYEEDDDDIYSRDDINRFVGLVN